MEVNRATMVSHKLWKKAPTGANTALIASQAAENTPPNQLTTAPKTALIPSQTVPKNAAQVPTIPLIASQAPEKSPLNTAATTEKIPAMVSNMAWK